MEITVIVEYDGKKQSPSDFTEEIFNSEQGKNFSEEEKNIIRRFWEIVLY